VEKLQSNLHKHVSRVALLFLFLVRFIDFIINFVIRKPMKSKNTQNITESQSDKLNNIVVLKRQIRNGNRIHFIYIHIVVAKFVSQTKSGHLAASTL
jgi:predicted DNA-binding protein with PD1-like motif